MIARSLGVTERLAILLVLAALFSVLGFFIAGVTVADPVVRLLPHVAALTPRGPIPFMQTVRSLGAAGGGFFLTGHPQTPTWIILTLVVGFGTLWGAVAVVILRPARSD